MELKPFSRIVSAIRRRGFVSATFSFSRHLIYRLEEYKIRRWYRNANAKNVRFDIKYGVETSARIEVEELDVNATNKQNSNAFQSIYEDLFFEAMSHVRIDHTRYCFVDFGSGKGKALLLASFYPFKKIIGVEFSEALCRACERNIALFSSDKQKTKSFDVNCVDAQKCVLPNGPTVFFFFNPFRGTLMESVINNIAHSLAAQPRPAWIVYCNPDCASYIDAIEQFSLVASGRRYRVWKTESPPG